MVRFRCEQCDSLLESDLAPGSVERCPECKLQLVVPEPRKARYVLWTDERQEIKQDAAPAEPAEPTPLRVPKFIPKTGPEAVPPPSPVGARELAYRKLRAKSLSIRLLGWVFAALSVLLLLTCTGRDIPTTQFLPMLAACGVLLVGGVLLVAVAHLLVGICLIAMDPDREARPAM